MLMPMYACILLYAILYYRQVAFVVVFDAIFYMHVIIVNKDFLTWLECFNIYNKYAIWWWKDIRSVWFRQAHNNIYLFINLVNF